MTADIETVARQSSVTTAADALGRGELVAFATETVYGLGADARDGTAVAGIFAAKGRPHFNPLIVHVLDDDAAAALVDLGDVGAVLARAFWPGPLTLVARAHHQNGIASLVTAGLDTLAVRVPRHPVARALLEVANMPVAAPSANRSGKVSPTRASHVQTEFGAAQVHILDGGPCEAGIESTIVDVSDGMPRLLRHGSITTEMISEVLGDVGLPLAALPGEMDRLHPTAPGQLASHYAPDARIRMNAEIPRPGEGFLGFGSQMPKHAVGCGAAVAPSTINLSVSGDLQEAAANLFDALRTLDAASVETIAVMPIPDVGLGRAINDRLSRAAAPRD
ncbi:MAG: L-threonylcarbamoyladenylate synthase [Pseudomonadota bacterium]